LPTVYQWSGEVADIAEILEVGTPTLRYSGNGGDFEVFSRQDYESAFKEQGALTGTEQLATNPALLAAAQAHWHSSGANACTFAAYLSDRRGEFGWETYVLGGEVDARDLAATISALAQARLPDPEVEVLSVLLPDLSEEAELAALLARLSRLADWEIVETGTEEDPKLGDLVRLGLRAAVEFNHWAEILGFGQFASQPNTRLAPFTELAIRAKPPDRPRRNHRAYMADIWVDKAQVDFGRWWHETEEERKARLTADQDLRGKAKSTFSLRNSEWERRN
jgi:hypothetical protein